MSRAKNKTMNPVNTPRPKVQNELSHWGFSLPPNCLCRTMKVKNKSTLIAKVNKTTFSRRKRVHWSVRYAYGQIESATSCPETERMTGSKIEQMKPKTNKRGRKNRFDLNSCHFWTRTLRSTILPTCRSSSKKVVLIFSKIQLNSGNPRTISLPWVTISSTIE